MDYRTYRNYYKEHHRTLGCKITHMIGVPLIVFSSIVVFFDWEVALTMFFAGWALQFAGHLIFEKNEPALFAQPKKPLSYYYAVVYVAEQWWKLLTFAPLT